MATTITPSVIGVSVYVAPELIDDGLLPTAKLSGLKQLIKQAELNHVRFDPEKVTYDRTEPEGGGIIFGIWAPLIEAGA